MAKISRPLAWDYLSSREFVVAYDAWATRHFRRNYSRRTFARWAGVKSANFLTLVISGKRRLSGDWLKAFSRGAKLSESETLYLSKLSRLESHSASTDQLAVLDEISTLLAEQGANSEAVRALELSRSPLAWDILQLIDLADCDGTELWFRKRLRRSCNVKEVREALALLLSLKMIEKSDASKYRSCPRHIETPDQIQKAENARFHKFILDEAHVALDELDAEQRSFGSLTIGVDKSKIPSLRKELSAFGKMISRKYASNEPVNGEVVRLNLQLYPITHSLKNRGKK